MLHQLVATGPKRKYGLQARALEDGKLAKKQGQMEDRVFIYNGPSLYMQSL